VILVDREMPNRLGLPRQRDSPCMQQQPWNAVGMTRPAALAALCDTIEVLTPDEYLRLRAILLPGPALVNSCCQSLEGQPMVNGNRRHASAALYSPRIRVKLFSSAGTRQKMLLRPCADRWRHGVS